MVSRITSVTNQHDHNELLMLNTATELNFKKKKIFYFKVTVSPKYLPPCKIEFRYTKDRKTNLNVYASLSHSAPTEINCEKRWINQRPLMVTFPPASDEKIHS